MDNVLLLDMVLENRQLEKSRSRVNDSILKIGQGELMDRKYPVQDLR
jgi:hypothetical protein